MSLTAHSTGDVPLDRLRGLARELEPHLRLKVDEHQRFFGSHSFISLLANAPWWIKAFGAYSALYVAELVCEGVKETWRSRALIASRVQAVSAAPFRIFAGALSKIRVDLKPYTDIGIGLPIPEARGALDVRHFLETQLRLYGSEPYLIEGQIALFIHHLPALITLIKSEHLSEHLDDLLGPSQLLLLADGSLQVGWFDHGLEIERKEILALDAA